MSLRPRTPVLPLIALLLLAAIWAPSAGAHEAPADTWFPVQLPIDSYADTWGAPRSGGARPRGCGRHGAADA